MSNDQIRELVNGFCRVTVRYALPLKSNDAVALRQVDDNWELIAGDRGELKKMGVEKIFDFPKDLPDDPTELAIDLAGFLSEKIKRYFTAKKANANRTPEQRKASARKAINSRWSK